MINSKKLFSFFSSVFLSFSFQAANGASITWDAQNAVALGSGCNNRDEARPIDTFFIANGDDVAIVMGGIGINMPAYEGAPLMDRKNCSVRIPARVQEGYYVGQFKQTLSYGIIKTSGSRGSLSMRSAFFNVPSSPFSMHFMVGERLNRPIVNKTRVDNYIPFQNQLCRSPSGILKMDLSLSGQRNSDYDDFVLFTDSLDLRIDSSVYQLELCPR